MHCTVLHCTVLYCTALHRTALHCTVLYCTALHRTALYCTVLYCTALHCTALHCTALHCTALHCTALHCTALHCTALHCTVPHCTALHCTSLHKMKPFLSLWTNPINKNVPLWFLAVLTAIVYFSRNHVPGVAHTRNVQSFVARNATVSDAMSHAERPYQEGLVFTTTRASGFVGNHVPSCAESVIRTKLPRSFLALKRRKMHGLLSCWIVVTCLKSLHWTTGWTKMVTTRTLN